MKIITLLSAGAFALVLALAACAASAPSATPADRVVCHQFYVYDNPSAAGGGLDLHALEAQYQSDPAPSAAVSSDMSSYLLLMESGGWAPGSGEQTQTAQAAVNVINDCTKLHAYR
jgi:hypothetical protein